MLTRKHIPNYAGKPLENPPLCREEVKEGEVNTFHNTISARGPELTTLRQKAGSQQDLILAFFRQNYGKFYTPFEVQAAIFDTKTPITSIRRGITNLTDAGLLRKSMQQREGEYGVVNHLWTYETGRLF